MDFKKQHPLFHATSDNNLAMLEMLIPYVDYPFKLPLALFIKFSELQILLKTFQHTENLEPLGLHTNHKSLMDLLSALTGVSPDLIQMIVNLSENGFSDLSNQSPFDTSDTTNQSLNPFLNIFAGNSHTTENDTNSTANNKISQIHFDERINQIFEEYDNQK